MNNNELVEKLQALKSMLEKSDGALEKIQQDCDLAAKELQRSIAEDEENLKKIKDDKDKLLELFFAKFGKGEK